jgi:C4-type Zn-finger protein
MTMSLEVHMNISVEKLLHKIEEELKEAKGTNSDAKIRERVHAIKTMCELILEESTTVTSTTTTLADINKPSNLIVSNPTYRGQVASMPNQQERLIIDEESNGESIFDF